MALVNTLLFLFSAFFIIKSAVLWKTDNMMTYFSIDIAKHKQL